MQRPYTCPITHLRSLLTWVRIGLNYAHLIHKQYRHCSANAVGQLYHSSVLPTLTQCLPHESRTSHLLSAVRSHVCTACESCNSVWSRSVAKLCYVDLVVLLRTCSTQIRPWLLAKLVLPPENNGKNACHQTTIFTGLKRSPGSSTHRAAMLARFLSTPDHFIPISHAQQISPSSQDTLHPPTDTGVTLTNQPERSKYPS
jgi:hypothetical protein